MERVCSSSELIVPTSKITPVRAQRAVRSAEAWLLQVTTKSLAPETRSDTSRAQACSIPSRISQQAWDKAAAFQRPPAFLPGQKSKVWNMRQDHGQMMDLGTTADAIGGWAQIGNSGRQTASDTVLIWSGAKRTGEQGEIIQESASHA